MDHVINWVWQGALVAAMAATVLRLMERTRAHARFLVCWLALAATATLPLLSAGLREATAAPIAASAATLATPVMTMPVTWWTSSSLALVAGGLWFLWAIGRVVADILGTRRSRLRCTSVPAGSRITVAVLDRDADTRPARAPGTVAGCGGRGRARRRTTDRRGGAGTALPAHARRNRSRRHPRMGSRAAAGRSRRDRARDRSRDRRLAPGRVVARTPHADRA